MTTRCLNCNGLLTPKDPVCYGCGDPVPKWVKSSSIPKRRRHSFVSNVTFLASLALSGYCLVAPQRPPLAVSLAASGVLLLVKLIVDWAYGHAPSPRRPNPDAPLTPRCQPKALVY